MNISQWPFLFFCLFISLLYAHDCVETDAECCLCNYDRTRMHQIYAGPEIYYIERLREQGTKQQGWACGIKTGYERIKRFSIYWGMEALYAIGQLHGTSSTGNSLKSDFRDAHIEGRLGYTFQQKYGRQMFITPYLGGGYAWETNNFVSPSPLHIHTQIKYGYACGGFLSGMNLAPCWAIGLNFKAKYIIDAINKVTNDPEFEDSNLRVNSEWQYRVELPLTYLWRQQYQISVVPFYEYRHYGKHLNFPFDFLETQLNIYGATIKFIYNL